MIDLPRDLVRMRPVVGIMERDKFAPRLGQARVARHIGAAVAVHPDHPDARIVAGEGVRHLCRTVAAGIVDHQALEIAPVLPLQRTKRRGEALARVMRGDEDERPTAHLGRGGGKAGTGCRSRVRQTHRGEVVTSQRTIDPARRAFGSASNTACTRSASVPIRPASRCASIRASEVAGRPSRASQTSGRVSCRRRVWRVAVSRSAKPSQPRGVGRIAAFGAQVPQHQLERGEAPLEPDLAMALRLGPDLRHLVAMTKKIGFATLLPHLRFGPDLAIGRRHRHRHRIAPLGAAVAQVVQERGDAA